MNCPACHKEMVNLGNISGAPFMLCPAAWDEVHVCHACKTKFTDRVPASRHPEMAKPLLLSEYQEVQFANTAQ